MQYVFLIRSRAGCKKYVTRLRLVTYFLQPALERIKNTYCMDKRPFLYLYILSVVGTKLFEFGAGHTELSPVGRDDPPPPTGVLVLCIVLFSRLYSVTDSEACAVVILMTVSRSRSSVCGRGLS